MKCMHIHVSACALACALACAAAEAQVPSSALHRDGVDSAPAASSAWAGPGTVNRRPATAPAVPQPTPPLRIVDPQDNAHRTRSNFRITIATSAAYANRLATVTVQQTVGAAIPTGSYGSLGPQAPASTGTLPVTREAKWEMPVSQLLQGWSPPVSKGWDFNLWFENIAGDALVTVSFVVPERAERLSADTHVTFGKIDVVRATESATRPPLQWTPAPSREPASGGRRP